MLPTAVSSSARTAASSSTTRTSGRAATALPLRHAQDLHLFTCVLRHICTACARCSPRRRLEGGCPVARGGCGGRLAARRHGSYDRRVRNPPPGYQKVSPYLLYEDAPRAIEHLKAAFG